MKVGKSICILIPIYILYEKCEFNMQFNEFVKLCEKLSKKFKDVELIIHPAISDPKEGWSICFEKQKVINWK